MKRTERKCEHPPWCHRDGRHICSTIPFPCPDGTPQEQIRRLAHTPGTKLRQARLEALRVRDDNGRPLSILERSNALDRLIAAVLEEDR